MITAYNRYKVVEYTRVVCFKKAKVAAVEYTATPRDEFTLHTER